MPVIDLNKIKTENHWTNKVKDFGKKVVNKTREAIDYVKENPQEAMKTIGIAATAVGGATKLVKSISRHQQIRQEKHHREREVYDRSLNMYLETKRKLTKKDFDKINEIRNRTGKRTSEVLSDLNLLKK